MRELQETLSSGRPAPCMIDDIYFQEALQMCRDASGDDRDFADLPSEVQREIIRHAQQIKADREREKRG